MITGIVRTPIVRRFEKQVFVGLCGEKVSEVLEFFQRLRDDYGPNAKVTVDVYDGELSTTIEYDKMETSNECAQRVEREERLAEQRYKRDLEQYERLKAKYG